MERRLIVGLCAALIFGATPSAAGERDHPVFRMDRVWSLQLEISAEEWDAIQPLGQTATLFGPPPAAAPTPDRPAPRLDRHVSAFGLEFPWGVGTLTVDGKSYRVGLRFKGNSAYSTAGRGPKRPFKIDFDRVDPAQRFHGLKALNLNNNALDPTQIREALAYSVFRALGVPASRTAFAEVTLTVPGRYDREYLGLYTLIEEVDKSFLKERFGKANGLLLKPEVRLREMTRREPIVGIDDLGDEWPRYAAHYNPKTEPTLAQRERFMQFARLVGSAADDEFAERIEDYLNVEEFLRYLAGNAFLVNLDSYMALGHNYYIYLDPGSNRFVFIPWDLNLSFAGLVMGGTVDQLLELSMTHPHWDQNKLIDRILAIPKYRESYHRIVQELVQDRVPRRRLEGWIADWRGRVGPILEKEKAAAAARKDTPGFPMLTLAPTLEKFLEKRYAALEAQQADPSRGYVPKNLMRPDWMLSGRKDWAKKLIAGLDRNQDGLLSEEELTSGIEQYLRGKESDDPRGWSEQKLAEGINELLARPGQRPAAGPLSPGTILAGALLRRGDTNRDGFVSAAELIELARQFHREANSTSDRPIDESQIAEGILNFVTKPRPIRR